jgi:hypothetical protein
MNSFEGEMNPAITTSDLGELSAMNELFDAARALAEKGKPVFPCRSLYKEPLTRRGFKDATTDPQVIQKWWHQYPNANVAIATGAISGLVALDLDNDPEKGKNGADVLAKLVKKHGPLPKTRSVRTPRGGLHYYFRHPGSSVRIPCSTDKLGKGLDVRGDGGYVLVPPSRTERGEYTWECKDPLAELPAWLLDLLLVRASGESDSGRATPLTNSDESRVREALCHIPSNLPHDDWIRILMGLHAWDPVRGKTLGHEWSALCPEKFRERDFESAWRSFKSNGGVSIGTLFEMARRYGWNAQLRQSVCKQDSPIAEESLPDVVISQWPEPPRPEAFHGPLGDFVRRLEPHTESDPMALLMQALVGFGNLLGRLVHFEVEADKHYCNLNVVTVGSSSKARKGTSWGHVIRLLREVDPSWPPYITGLSTGEGLIACVRDPVVKRGKGGQEEVVDEGVSDKRLLAVESEFGRTLQCSNRDGNTLSAVLRQAFDSLNLKVAVKGSPQMSTGAHIGVVGHITIVELIILLSQSDCANGFANRFLWVAVRRSKLLPEGGDAASIDFSDIIARLRKALEFAQTAGRVSRNEKAVELWRQIYFSLSRERPGLLGAVVSRAEAIVMRLAMILAVTDCSLKIEEQHLQAALAIWDYCEASATFIFGDSLGNPIAERVLQLLQNAGERGLSLAAIYEGLSGHVEKEQLHSALKQLYGVGLARFEKVKTSGRPSQIWSATKAASERSEQSAKKAAEAEVNPFEGSTPSKGLSSLNSLNSPAEAWEETI